MKITFTPFIPVAFCMTVGGIALASTIINGSRDIGRALANK